MVPSAAEPVQLLTSRPRCQVSIQCPKASPVCGAKPTSSEPSCGRPRWPQVYSTRTNRPPSTGVTLAVDGVPSGLPVFGSCSVFVPSQWPARAVSVSTGFTGLLLSAWTVLGKVAGRGDTGQGHCGRIARTAPRRGRARRAGGRMNHEEAGRLWNGNADAWSRLARAGYDVYRDHLNTPAFFAMLPGVEGLTGLDIGCGEGHNTRLLARRGARMTAVDIAEAFIGHARQAEADEPLGIDFRIASAVDLPFQGGAFDFAAGFMSFMDVPETDRVLAEAFRVLKPGGFLQFSICHPCF